MLPYLLCNIISGRLLDISWDYLISGIENNTVVKSIKINEKLPKSLLALYISKGNNNKNTLQILKF